MLKTDWETVTLAAKETRTWVFEIRFNDAIPQGKPLSLAGAIENVEARYAALPGTGTGHAEFPWGAASTLALAYRLYRQGPLRGLK